ncbi:MAG: hypothetical protein Q9227_002700 [Pyrenula ochraceoflavens]
MAVPLQESNWNYAQILISILEESRMVHYHVEKTLQYYYDDTRLVRRRHEHWRARLRDQWMFIGRGRDLYTEAMHPLNEDLVKVLNDIAKSAMEPLIMAADFLFAGYGAAISPIDDVSPCSTGFGSSLNGSGSNVTLGDNVNLTNFNESHASSLKRKRAIHSPGPEEKRQKKLATLTKSQSDHICKDCSQIDFQKVFELDPARLSTEKKGVLIADLGSRLRRPNTNSCALCHLLAGVSAKRLFHMDFEDFELRAYSILKFSVTIRFIFCPRDLNDKDQPFLAVVPKRLEGKIDIYDAYVLGQVFCSKSSLQTTNLFSPEPVPKLVDFSLVTYWLDYCKLRHKKLCGRNTTHSPELKVIDCDSLSVITAPSPCSYAALSYVWSKTGRTVPSIDPYCNNSSVLQVQNGSQTIRDAVTVTKRLGLRYLWIDRYCIDQGDPYEKHKQIQSMDSVYRGAEITIIAAAGQDENYGLPGVRTPRVPQLMASVRDIQILCTMVHPHEEIKKSVWSTRGWTYQEAVLSRRCIAFTDHQIYFECNAMNCCESLRGNLDVLHTKNKYKSLKMLHNGIFGGRDGRCFAPVDAENLSVDRSLRRCMHLITNYSRRNLTFEEDSLNAFAGIARHLAKSKNPIFNIAGLPFPYPPKKQGSEPFHDRDYLAKSLLWVHDNDDELGPICPTRRPAFPSWSWGGWSGPVTFLRGTFRSGFSSSNGLIIYFEFEPGCLVEQCYFLRHSALGDLQYRSPRGLQLDVMVVIANYLTFSEDRPPTWQFRGFPAGIYPSECLADFAENPMVIVDNFKTRKWLLVLIAEIHDETYFMIVRQEISNVSRVGVIVVEGKKIRSRVDMSLKRIRWL